MWDRVVPLLTSAGHRAEAPNLLGADPADAGFPQEPISGWAEQIVDLVRAAEGPVVLVGQSRGGLIISEVADRVPERIGYLIYASAFLLPDGASLLGTFQNELPDAAPPFTVREDGMTMVLPEALDKIYSKTPAHWLEIARANQCPDPLTAGTTPLSLSETRFGSVPRAYIEATSDEVLPLSVQRPCRSSFLATQFSRSTPTM